MVPKEQSLKIKISAKKDVQKNNASEQKQISNEASSSGQSLTEESKKKEATQQTPNNDQFLELLEKAIASGTKKSWNLKDLQELKSTLEQGLKRYESIKNEINQQITKLDAKEKELEVKKAKKSNEFAVCVKSIKKPVPLQVKEENEAATSKQPKPTAPIAESQVSKPKRFIDDYFTKTVSPVVAPSASGSEEAETIAPVKEPATKIPQEEQQMIDSDIAKQAFLSFEEVSQVQQRESPKPLDSLLLQPEAVSLGPSQDLLLQQSDNTKIFSENISSPRKSKKSKMKKKKKNVVDDEDDEYNPNLEQHEEEEEEEEGDTMDEDLLVEPSTPTVHHVPQPIVSSTKKGKARRKRDENLLSSFPTPVAQPFVQSQQEIEPPTPSTPIRKKDHQEKPSTKKKSSQRQRKRRKASDMTAEADELFFDSDDETKGFGSTAPNHQYWNYIQH